MIIEIYFHYTIKVQVYQIGKYMYVNVKCQLP